MRWRPLCVIVVLLAHSAGAQRPVQCGDQVLGAGEQCDDGNGDDGDGCSSMCTLEDGFMCMGFGRVDEAVLGVRLEQDEQGVYGLTGDVERCLGTDLCSVTGLWQPELWGGYAGGPMPPRAYYCGGFCSGFGLFAGLQHSGTCQLVDTDECVRGEAACDFNAVCENTAVGAGDNGLGYRCRCDSNYFPLQELGQQCAVNGVELVLRVIGSAAFDGQLVPPADTAALLTMQVRLVDHLIDKGVVQSTSARAALLEGLEGHEPELITVLADPATGFSGHALWAVKVRLAFEHAQAAVLMDLLSPTVDIGAGLDTAVFAGLDLRARVRGVCSTDTSRECAGAGDCLDGGTCRTGVPDIRATVLDAGGSTSPVTVRSGGLQVLSAEYDSAKTAWVARVRYAKTDLASAMSVLYLPHITTPVGAVEQATFRTNEFPCQAPGTGAFEQDRTASVCCLAHFAQRYTPTQAFADYYAARSELHCSGADLATAPANTTRALLAGAGDFVAGPFARTSRSSAVLDGVQSVSGYQDVLLELAEEDMRAMGGIVDTLPGGFRLRFFIGMAHFSGTPPRVRAF